MERGRKKIEEEKKRKKYKEEKNKRNPQKCKIKSRLRELYKRKGGHIIWRLVEHI